MNNSSPIPFLQRGKCQTFWRTRESDLMWSLLLSLSVVLLAVDAAAAGAFVPAVAIVVVVVTVVVVTVVSKRHLPATVHFHHF